MKINPFAMIGGFLCCLSFAPLAFAKPSLYGLVIGVNDYASLNSLKGSVNDALDIAQLLDELGAAKKHVLLDNVATRDAVFAAWDDLVDLAKPGDTILLSYSGHGSQEPERIKGSESDGKDELTVLGGFDINAPMNAQRIYDKEWRQLITRAEGVNVIQLFDSCNSGSATRSLNRKDLALPARWDDYGDIVDDSLPPPPSVTRRIGNDTREIYFGGTQDGSLVYELPIDGTPRGALSAFFAKGVRGAADENSDGIISRGEIARYVDHHVRRLTEGRQKPSVVFSSSDDAPLLASVSDAQMKSTDDGAVTFDIVADNKKFEKIGNLPGGIRVRAPMVPEISWDASEGRVYRHGEMVAELKSLDRFQGELQRWAAIQSLDQTTKFRHFESTILEGPKRYLRNESVKVRFGARNYAYLTIVNIGPGGLVNFLFPRPGEESELCQPAEDSSGSAPPQQDLNCEFTVVPEFGTEHLIAVSSKEKLADLHQKLARIDGLPQPLVAARGIRSLSRNATDISVVGVYTGDAP